MWKIAKTVSKGDYSYAVVKDHPNSTKHGYVLYHRIVVENEIGRLLEKKEIVHHKNGDKKDNRIENLEILSSSDHARMHGLRQGAKWCTLKCPQCKKIFERERRHTFLAKRSCNCTCCSRSCNGKMCRSLQLGRNTDKIKIAISENLVKEYIKFS